MDNKLVIVSRETILDELEISPERIIKLELFQQIVISELQRHQIVSRNDKKNIWNRHIVDSLMMMFHVKQFNIRELTDIGAGGGFPGIVLSIVDERIRINLVERKKKRCDFLRRTIDEIDVKNAVVQCCDAFEGKKLFDFVVSRAVFGTKTRSKVHSLISDKGMFFNYQNDLFEIPKMKRINSLEYVLPGEEKKRFLSVFIKNNHA